jgi:hypothetical protein
MKYFISLIIFSSIALVTRAQDDTLNTKELTFKKSPHQIGLHAGSTTGLGFSYRLWPDRFGIQITGIPTFREGRSFSSVGLSGLYLFNENKVVDFFGYVGNHLIISTSTQNIGSYGNPVYEKTSDFIYNIGVGFGLKFKFLEVLDFNIQTGYSILDVTNGPYSMIAGEIGIYYHL